MELDTIWAGVLMIELESLMEAGGADHCSDISAISSGGGLWAAMHSSAAACSAGLSEHSCAVSSASTVCRSWHSHAASRLKGSVVAQRIPFHVRRRRAIPGAGEE